MSPTPQETDYSVRTKESLLENALFHLELALISFQNLKPLRDRLRDGFEPADLQVVGLILDPLAQEVEIERPSQTRGRTATAVHLVVKNEGIKALPEDPEVFYAVGRPYGQTIDFYPLEGSSDLPEIDWGQSSPIYTQKASLVDSSEPRTRRKKTLFGSITREHVFLSFNSPTPLGSSELVEKIKSVVPQNKKLLAIADGIQAAYAI
jgi:hypothetical protein